MQQLPRVSVAVVAALLLVTTAGCGGPSPSAAPGPAPSVSAAAMTPPPPALTPQATFTGPPSPWDPELNQPAPGVPPEGIVENFADPTDLADWRVSLGEAMSGSPAQVSVHDGVLEIVAAHSEWLDNEHATGVARSVTGDVTVVAEIDVRGTAGPTPGVDWSLAGIMLRAPDSQGDESWVHWSAGHVQGPTLERKSTRAGSSQLSLIAIEPGPVTLQLIRAGSQIVLLHRQGSAPWTRDVVYGRDDLPATAEVLLTAQSGGESDHGDMTATYDDVTITPGAPLPDVIEAVIAGDTSGLPY